MALSKRQRKKRKEKELKKAKSPEAKALRLSDEAGYKKFQDFEQEKRVAGKYW